MSKFIVDLGELKLSEAQKAEISASIQQVVLSHVAKLPASEVKGGWWCGHRPPILGIIYDPNLEEIAKRFS